MSYTVKIRNEKGNENLFEARRVEWIDEITEGEEGYIHPGLLVHYDGGGSTHYEALYGKSKAWVMNKDGATVATYEF
jgi:hypothetical protein